MDCSMPGFTVLHYLLEFAQIHVLWVGKAIILQKKKKAEKLKEAKVISLWVPEGKNKWLLAVWGWWHGCGIYLVEGKAGAAWPGRGRRKQQMWAHRGYKLPSPRIFIGHPHPPTPQDKAWRPPNQTVGIEIGLWHQLWHIHSQCERETAMDLASGKSLVISARLSLRSVDEGTRVGRVEESAGGEEGHPGATNH